jgi:2-polyprenyl-3-methyl-5-hydroxy-6-metoxy-1,4-benzoquinol methylase
MSCTQCAGIAQEFDARVARRDLRRYRKRGASKTTTWLLDMVVGEGVRGATFLDVGGGVGALQHGLVRAGAAAGIHADASPAYLAAAREESKRLGHAERIRSLEGDFVALASEIEPVDVVTLDRVICCYDDLEALVDASATRAKRVYGLVFPRERLTMRVGAWILNRVQRMRRRAFKVYLHPLDAVEARIESHGLLKRFHRRSFLWHVQVYTRNPGRSGGA